MTPWEMRLPYPVVATILGAKNLPTAVDDPTVRSVEKPKILEEATSAGLRKWSPLKSETL
jgi:hypothetical protein